MHGFAGQRVGPNGSRPITTRHRLRAVAAALALLAAPTVAPLAALANAPGLATVAARSPLLAGPQADAAELGQLQIGDEVELTGQTALGYLEVEFRGQRGWVASSDLAVSDRAGIPLAEAADGAAIRAAPMPDAEILGRVPPGGVAILTGAQVGAYVAGSFEGVGGWLAESDLALPLDADGPAR